MIHIITVLTIISIILIITNLKIANFCNLFILLPNY